MVIGEEPGSAQAFLQAARHHIGAPAVARNLHAPNRGGGIDIDQRAHFARNSANAIQRLRHGGGGITMHGTDKFWMHPACGLGNCLYRHHLAPRGIHRFISRADARQNLLQQQTKPAEIDHQRAFTGRNKADQRGFNACPGRAIHQHGPGVGRAKHRAVQRHHLVHVAGHFRVELAQHVGTHRAQHAWVGVDWARSHQQALGRINLTEIVLGQISQKLSHVVLQFHQCAFAGPTPLAALNLAYNPAAEPSQRGSLAPSNHPSPTTIAPAWPIMLLTAGTRSTTWPACTSSS
jgi:hypothetical protein